MRRLKARNSAIKRALLDQTLVAGIGNIYADEALWRAQVHEAVVQRVDQADARAVLVTPATSWPLRWSRAGRASTRCISASTGSPGTSTPHAYGQEGRPCDRCGTPIRQQFMTARPSRARA